MTAAIRTLILLTSSRLVPPRPASSRLVPPRPAVWLAVEGEHVLQTSRATGGPGLTGLEAITLIVLLSVTLITVTLAGSFAVSNAIARRRGAWALGLSLELAPTSSISLSLFEQRRLIH
jgi:hypothetical protein